MDRSLARPRRAAPAVALALALSAVFAVSPASAIIVELVPDQDNTLYESGTGALSNGAGPSFFAGRTAQPTGSIRRGLVRFDVAGALPAGATITSAVLVLHLTATASAVESPVTLHRVTSSWGEGTSNAGESGGAGAPSTANDATWRHRFFPATNWTALGGDFVAASSASAPVGDLGSYAWGSTPAMVADVQGWLDVPANNFGWLVRGLESSGGTSKKFESRQSSTPSLRPVLRIDYTIPVPARAATWGRVKAGYRD